MGAFIDVYNREWLVEKNGFLSPSEARARYKAEHTADAERRAA